MSTRKTVMITGAATALAAAMAVPMLTNAQDYAADPAISELEAMLVDDRSRFRIEVERDVTDDLLELGRLVAMGGSQAGGSGMACIACHGVEGEGDGSGAFPRLAGQSGWYLYKQLIDYASGARPNDVMSSVAERLTEHEMEAVSAYYAAIDAPYAPVMGDIDPGMLQWGGQLGAVGSAERGIPACVNCHGPSGTGMPPSVPYLAGQYANYMTHQLQLWADGVRDNDAMNVMSAIADKMTEEDMRAVSEYYARVRPAERGEAEIAIEVDMTARTE
ncbi:Cytochrome c4 [Roseibacterium elongatum DSM 19469]|uniref:Cytochrome c4 n=1 Tax=Roseicyclus elongatus DSM 19469 TaxID=1294273 RepID=W8SRE0_9RHOB|nr:c-type cytochrome [Roseibacterium elongatum]AHM05095.1 Cytochrome c4 [Roseibacterium elongatum DSM 19469]